MSCLRTALLSASLLVASAAAAQSTPVAPAAEPAAPQPTGAVAPPAAPPAPTPAGAGPAAPQAPARYGLGVSLGGDGWAPSLYLPIDLSGTRFELEAGYVSRSAGDVEASTGRLGIGLFGLIPTSPGMQAYVGGRLQYVHEGVTGASSDGLRAAFALGGEWAPAPAVALGVEWQVGYTAASGAAKGIDATALAFLRVFLATFEPRLEVSSAGEQPKPARVVKCARNFDCNGAGICYEGVCRK